MNKIIDTDAPDSRTSRPILKDESWRRWTHRSQGNFHSRPTLCQCPPVSHLTTS